jgi:hypothetical protein
MFDRSKVWAVILLAAVFAAGAIAGWGIQAWADTRDPRRSRGGRSVDAIVSGLTAELELTAVQQDSVRAVLVRRKAAMDALWESVHPQFDSLRAQMRSEIRSQLTPEQQAKYQEWIAEMDRRRHGGDSSSQRKR